jgi:N-methylhydantoinase A
LIEALQSLQARTLSSSAKEHWPAEKIRSKFAVDLRYAKQSHDVTVELPDLTPESVNRLPEMFESRHVELFGRAHKIDVMVRTIRIAITAEAPFGFRLLEPKDASPTQERATRPVWFSGTQVKTPIIQRSKLPPGFTTAGPAVIAEYGATTIVPPNWQMHVAQNSALVITRQ